MKVETNPLKVEIAANLTKNSFQKRNFDSVEEAREALEVGSPLERGVSNVLKAPLPRVVNSRYGLMNSQVAQVNLNIRRKDSGWEAVAHYLSKGPIPKLIAGPYITSISAA